MPVAPRKPIIAQHVSRSRQNPPVASTTLWTLSLAVCLSAAAVAEPRTVPTARAAETGERFVLNARQRHALASLFAHLTDAARQWHRAPQVVAAPAASARPVSGEMPEPAALRRPPDRPHTLPTPPLREALRNLPPPTH